MPPAPILPAQAAIKNIANTNMDGMLSLQNDADIRGDGGDQHCIFLPVRNRHAAFAPRLKKE